MKNWGLLAVGGLLAVAGIWLLTRKKGPRWQEGERLPTGITVARVQLIEATGQYAYWLEYDERPGELFGPFTEQEVLAQLPSAIPSALVEAGTR